MTPILTPTQRYLRTRLALAAVLITAGVLLSLISKSAFSEGIIICYLTSFTIPRVSEPSRALTAHRRRLLLSLVVVYFTVLVGFFIWFLLSSAILVRFGFALVACLPYMITVSERWKFVSNPSPETTAPNPNA